MNHRLSIHGAVFVCICLITSLVAVPASASVNLTTSQPISSLMAQSIAPVPPNGVNVTAHFESVTISWNAVPGVAKYAVYRSQVQGSNYTLVTEVPHKEWTGSFQYQDSGLTNQVIYYYVVSAFNAVGQESRFSNEVNAMPHLPIGWAGTIYPHAATYTMGSEVPVVIDGEIYVQDFNNPGAHLSGRRDPITGQFIPIPGIIAQFGYGPASLPPSQWTNWIDASFYGGWLGMPDPPELSDSPHDRYRVQFYPKVAQGQWQQNEAGEVFAEFEYGFRFSSTLGRSWTYAGLFWMINPDLREGEDPHIPFPSVDDRGKLRVTASLDSTAPGAPSALSVTQVSASSITLQWQAVVDADLKEYEVLRAQTAGGPYGHIASTQPGVTTLVDSNLTAGTTYYYVVRAVDYSQNASAYSNEVAQETIPRQIQVSINVNVPDFTPGDTIYLNHEITSAGLLGPQNWQGEILTRAAPNGNTFTTTLSIQEGLRYSFLVSRGSAGTVQTLADGNTPAYDPSFLVQGDENGMQTINISVANWEDPLVISSLPSGSAAVSGYSAISIQWNQAMPASTQFALVDETANNAPVAGGFSQDPSGQILTFTPQQPLTGGHTYTVTVQNQYDLQTPSAVQQTQAKSWSFLVDFYRLHMPITFRN